MTTIGPWREGDREAILALYRRVFGDAAADALALRWDWLYVRNPALAGGPPRIWVVRDGEAVVGQYATMPVRLAVPGAEVDAAWGCDVMLAPELQGQGVGGPLFRAWDAGCGAAIGLSLTDASHKLFQKLAWPHIGAVPRFAKPLTDAARATFGEGRPSLVSRLSGAMRAIAAPPAAAEPLVAFDARADALWARVAPRFAFAVRRDAAYLNWRFLAHPSVRYEALAIPRGDGIAAWAVLRHVPDRDWQVTVLVDFLADPDDADATSALLAAVDAAARAAGSAVVRAWALHAGFQGALVRAGYHAREATLRFVAKVNAVPVPDGYYADTSRWHVTRGDSDADR